MTALSPRARDLFARARAEGAPSAAERARVFEQVSRAIAAPPSAGSPSAGLPSAAPKVTPALPIAGRMLLAIAALGTIGALSWSGIAARSNAATNASHVESAMHVATTVNGESGAPIASVLPMEDEAPSPPAILPEARLAAVAERDSTQPLTRRAPRPREEPSDLAAELAILRTAQRARRAGDLAASLSALDEHTRRFPHGVLVNERDVTRAAVVCESGDLARGRALAAPFASSAWAGALARACEPSGEQSSSLDETE